jgi:CheY-like chemotaxis protein
VVDDEESIRSLLKEYFEILGLEASAVASGPECLALLEKEEFGLILCDVSMPGMDGFEVFSRVQTLRPQQKFLFISGYMFAESRKNCLQKSLGLLHKPFHLNDLNQVLTTVFPEL